MTTPTLIIGLGGTGRQTLMQVRRLFLEDAPNYLPAEKAARDAFRKAYPPGRVPHVELLSIDTDERLLDLDGEAFDPVLRAAALSGVEVLDIKIVADKVASLYRERNAHPSYRDWYDFSLESSGIPQHGCGQTRPWGRLAFFHNQPEIAARIKGAVERLLGPDAANAAQAINVPLNNGVLKVQLVFSIAGGTGAGMFLDTAFLVRKIVADFPNVTLVLEALILLPTAFSNDPRHRVFANAYASLLEIEYYNRKREDSSREGWFPVLWEGEYSGRGEPSRLVGPTFDFAWLIGNVSRGPSKTRMGTRLGVAKEDKNALTGMIAEWQYLRCSPISESFGNNLNSYVIANALPLEASAVARLDVYPGLEARTAVESGVDFSRRFGSFGLAKIHAPSSLAQEKLAYRLVADMIGDWLQTPALEAITLEDELRAARTALNLLSNADALDADQTPMDMQVFALSRSIEHAREGQPLLSVVREAVESERTSVTEAESEQFERTFTEWRRRFRLQRISDEDPAEARKGDFARNVLGFAAERERDDAATLDAMLTRYLDQQGRGIPCARHVLDALKNDYDRIVQEAPGNAENEADAAREYETGATDRLGFYGGNGFIRRTVAKVCFNKQSNAFLADMGRQIYEATARLAASMSKLVAKKIHELDELQLQLSRLRREIDGTAGQLEQRPHSKLNRLLIPDSKEQYHTEDGKRLEDAGVRWVLMRGSPAPEGPWPVRHDLEGAARSRFRAQLVEFAKDRLDHVLRERTDVLSAFDKTKTDDSEYQTALRPLVDNATSWLDVRHEASRPWEEGQPMKVNRIVARPGTEAERKRLADQLGQLGFSLGAERLEHLGGPIDQVVIEEHMTGVPLFEVATLKAFRDQSYEPIMAGVTEGIGEFTNSALHLEEDIDKYGDLLKPDAQESERTERAMNLFLRALVTGVLDARKDETSGGIVFSYLKDIGLRPKRIELGRHPRVLRVLARSESAQAADIEPAVQEAEKRMWDEGATRRAEMLALLSYYCEESHPLANNRRFKRIAAQLLESTKGRADKKVIDLARNDMSPTLENWSEEVVPKSGFRRLKQ